MKSQIEKHELARRQSAALHSMAKMMRNKGNYGSTDFLALSWMYCDLSIVEAMSSLINIVHSYGHELDINRIY